MEDKSSNKIVFVTAVFMISTAALFYVVADSFLMNYQISKANYICTKIEQVGKNLDDVRCVQYTMSKYSKEAISMNSVSQIFASK